MAEKKSHPAKAAEMHRLAVPGTEQVASRLVPISYQCRRAARGSGHGAIGMALAALMHGLAEYAATHKALQRQTTRSATIIKKG